MSRKGTRRPRPRAPRVPPNEGRVLGLVRRRGVLRPRDLDPEGLPRSALARLVARGLVERLSRGLYAAEDRVPGVHGSLAEAARAVPRGVVCLLSALRFHGLGTQDPPEVWMAIARTASRPKVVRPPLRIVRFSGPLLREGVEVRRIGGVEVRITDPARTVVDAFRYRNKIGLDVALEALRDGWSRGRIGIPEVERYAALCRLSRVMRPYLESLT